MIGSNPLSAGEHAQPMSEINTTPLVDVMLVLLVIFIITAPILSHSQSKVTTSQKPTVVR